MKRIFGLLLLALITINCYSQNKVRGKLTTEINGFQWYNYKNKEAYTVDGRLLFKDDASKQIVFTIADNNDEGLFVVSYKNDKRLYYSNGNEIKYYTAGDLSYFTLEFERISIEYSQPYNKKYYTLVTYYSKIDNKKLYSYLIDLDGKLVTPCFDSYRIERNFIITTYKGNMWLIHANRPGASLEYTSIKFNDRSKCYVCKSSSAPFELFLINESGEMIGVAESITDKGDYMLIKYNHGLGVVSNVGKYVISTDCGYTSISKTNGNTQYYKVGKNGYYGLIDLSGKEIIPINRDYTSIGDFNTTNKTFAFTKKGYSGVCNEQGEEISLTKLPPTADDIKETGNYASATELMNGSIKYWKVSKGGRYGLTDAEGKVIVPTEMEALESAGTGYLRYKLNGFWGLMNYTGKIIIDTDRGYTSIGDFKTFNKRFSYTMTGYKGECDATGRQISKIKVETPKQNTSVASSSGSFSSSSSSSNSNSGNNTTTIHVEHHRDPVPVQQWQACWACGGMGTMGCDNCGGGGTKYIGDRLHRCSRCNGRGIIPCNICHGNKGQYITVYQ